jgi:hypothetical protein
MAYEMAVRSMPGSAGGNVVAMTHRSPLPWMGAALLAGLLMLAPAQAAATSHGRSTFAPYVDMTLNSDSLAKMKAGSGVHQMTLAFIVSGQPCVASWGGYYGLGDRAMRKRIAAFESSGGRPIVSFGGAAGQELADTCDTPHALATQYQAVIDAYGIRNLDFDIEGGDQGSRTTIDRRFQALREVQIAARRAGHPVRLSLTLPVMPFGLTQDGLGVIRSAITNNVQVSTVNVMTMDYGDPSLDYAGHMGDLAIRAVRSTHRQLAHLYPKLSDARVWRMLGATPMLGINDDSKEIFTVANADQLTSFAMSKGMSRLAMWSLNRDAPCPSPTTQTSNTCSGVSSARWAFSRAFGAFD